MRKIKLFFLSSVAVIVVLSSCRKSNDYPVVPSIAFKQVVSYPDAQGIDTTIRVTISFTDGDGDVGLRQEDVSAPFVNAYYYNLYLAYYEEKNGTFVPKYSAFPEDSITPAKDTIKVFRPVVYKYRIPYLVQPGRTKALKGEIEADISTLGFSPTSRFDIFIYDRALHKSNVITTPAFTINP